jgi:hypothetical protein
VGSVIFTASVPAVVAAGFLCGDGVGTAVVQNNHTGFCWVAYAQCPAPSEWCPLFNSKEPKPTRGQGDSKRHANDAYYVK